MAASSITRRSPRLGRDSGAFRPAAATSNASLESVRFGYWLSSEWGIYFIDFDVQSDARRPVKILQFPVAPGYTGGARSKNTVSWSNTPGFAISPDGRWLLYTSLESTDARLDAVWTISASRQFLRSVCGSLVDPARRTCDARGRQIRVTSWSK
jgi:hypothetical protein